MEVQFIICLQRSHRNQQLLVLGKKRFFTNTRFEMRKNFPLRTGTRFLKAFWRKITENLSEFPEISTKKFIFQTLISSMKNLQNKYHLQDTIKFLKTRDKQNSNFPSTLKSRTILSQMHHLVTFMSPDKLLWKIDLARPLNRYPGAGTYKLPSPFDKFEKRNQI